MTFVWDKGSSIDIKEVRELIKQYRMSKKLMKKFKGKKGMKGIEKMMKGMGNIPMKFK